MYIKRVSEGLLIIPKDKYTEELWSEWATKLAQYDESLEIERGGVPQTREGLDEIFP